MASYTIELRKVCEFYTREEVEKWFKSYKEEEFLTQEQINVIKDGRRLVKRQTRSKNSRPLLF